MPLDKSMLHRFNVIDERIKDGVYLYGAGMNGSWVHDFIQRTPPTRQKFCNRIYRF